jgi:uncharacterized protein involved in exopolysaccharide biosynthesis
MALSKSMDEFMPATPFDPIELLRYLRKRLPFLAACCASAILFALVISLALPKKFTSTAQVLIEAPGGNDPRAATAVSPVYLESLKVYERVASSDTLFLRALDHVQLGSAASGRSVESLKRSILHVLKPSNTAILEISVTLTDPKKAQALAQYVAEQTVEISRTVGSQSESDTTSEARARLDQGRTRLEQARAALARREPIEGIESRLNENSALKLDAEKNLSAAQTELAGDKAELDALGGRDALEADSLGRAIASARARVAVLERERDRLSKQIADSGGLLSARQAADAEEQSAQTEFESANSRLSDLLASQQLRGERLKMIDPGIVPQEPSSPNVPLNLLVALLLSFAAGVIYLAIAFALGDARRRSPEADSTPAWSLVR